MADSMSSQQAVGSIETKGFPAVLAAADAMLKAGRVTLVGYLRAGSADLLSTSVATFLRSNRQWRLV
jgi:hypothetical protein